MPILLSPRMWIAMAITALLAVVCWYGYNVIYDRGANSVQAKWDVEKLQVIKQSAQLRDAAHETTLRVQAVVDKALGDKDEKISVLNRRLEQSLSRLRDRQDRPSEGNMPNSPSLTESKPGCTGAGLYRSDGEFLSRFATDTARLQLELKACYTQYDAAQAALIN